MTRASTRKLEAASAHGSCPRVRLCFLFLIIPCNLIAFAARGVENNHWIARAASDRGRDLIWPQMTWQKSLQIESDGCQCFFLYTNYDQISTECLSDAPSPHSRHTSRAKQILDRVSSIPILRLYDATAESRHTADINVLLRQPPSECTQWRQCSSS